MKKNNEASLEALLFAYGEPLEIKKISQILDVTEDEVLTVYDNLKNGYEKNDSGLSIIKHDKKLQLVSNPKLSPTIESLIKKEFHEELTPAAEETLSIIAYAGPITRIDIDNVRGVNSTFMLRNLLLRGLIERGADPNRPNAYIYSVSFEFLKHLGLTKIEDLPDREKYIKLINDFKNQGQS